VAGFDPGAGRVRLALVAPLDECVEAAWRIRRYVETLAP
jgi:N-succinyldiaminopimelate aminotransferase